MKREVVYRHKMGKGMVRFVRSPLARIDIPWVVVSDMLRHAGAHEESLRRLIAGCRQSTAVQTVQLEGGIETIAPIWTLFHLRDALGMPGSPGKIIIAAVRAAYPNISANDRMTLVFAAPSLTGKEI